jgi:hypothetical protein
MDIQAAALGYAICTIGAFGGINTLSEKRLTPLPLGKLMITVYITGIVRNYFSLIMKYYHQPLAVFWVISVKELLIVLGTCTEPHYNIDGKLERMGCCVC